eukprot:922739-Amphidinium_carterae.1
MDHLVRILLCWWGSAVGKRPGPHASHPDSSGAPSAGVSLKLHFPQQMSAHEHSIWRHHRSITQCGAQFCRSCSSTVVSDGSRSTLGASVTLVCTESTR